MRQHSTTLLFLLCLLTLQATAFGRGPRVVIFDTDWWTDVDDVVALRLLLRAEREGRVQVLGTCIDAVNRWSAVSLDRFCRAEGRDSMPLGLDFQATDYNGRPPYQEMLSKAGPAGRITRNADCPDCVVFYRRLLSRAEGRVDIICVGYPNALARLLESEADSLSPLGGRELVRRKVRRLWMMGGQYPAGRENNFRRTARSIAAARRVVSEWPSPITFLGYEVGHRVVVGGLLAGTPGAGQDLLYLSLLAHKSPQGRYAWDPMLTWMACLGSEKRAGYRCVTGTNVVDDEGANVFTPQRGGKHRYVIMRQEPEWYQAQLDTLLLP